MDNCCPVRPAPPQRGSADACKPPSRHAEGVPPSSRPSAEPPQRGSAARSPSEPAPPTSEPAPPQRKTPPHSCCANHRRAAVKASPDPPPARWCAVKQPSCRGGTPLSRGNTQHRPPPTEGCAAKGECRNAEGELPRPAVGRAKRPA